jgi:hypothetical protein
LVVIVMIVALVLAGGCSDDTTPAVDAAVAVDSAPPDAAQPDVVAVDFDVPDTWAPDAAQLGTTQWVTTATSSGFGRVQLYNTGFVDPAGNTHVAGVFSGTATFGSTKLTSSTGGYDLFITKLAPDGKFLWTVSAGGADRSTRSCVKADAAGDVYVASRFEGTATYGSVTHTSKGGTDLVVLKLSKDGAFLWAKAYGGPSDDAASTCALDPGGGVVVGGRFADTIAFDSTSLTSKGDADPFLVKLDPQGQVTQAWKPASGANTVSLGSIDHDGAGNLYIAGSFEGEASFGTESLTSAGGADVYVSKLSPAGQVLWTAHGGGTAHDEPVELLAESGGDVYVTGGIMGEATFGTFQLPFVAEADIFVAKISSSGTFLWASAAGGSPGSPSYPIDLGFGLALAKSGDLYVSGWFAHSITFGGAALTGCSNFEGFVARYDATTGTPTWVLGTKTVDPGCTRIFGAMFDSKGDLIIVGKYRGETTFGTTTLTSQDSSYDTFVWKLTPP